MSGKKAVVSESVPVKKSSRLASKVTAGVASGGREPPAKKRKPASVADSSDSEGEERERQAQTERDEAEAEKREERESKALRKEQREELQSLGFHKRTSETFSEALLRARSAGRGQAEFGANSVFENEDDGAAVAVSQPSKKGKPAKASKAKNVKAREAEDAERLRDEKRNELFELGCSQREDESLDQALARGRGFLEGDADFGDNARPTVGLGYGSEQGSDDFNTSNDEVVIDFARISAGTNFDNHFLDPKLPGNFEGLYDAVNSAASRDIVLMKKKSLQEVQEGMIILALWGFSPSEMSIRYGYQSIGNGVFVRIFRTSFDLRGEPDWPKTIVLSMEWLVVPALNSLGLAEMERNNMLTAVHIRPIACDAGVKSQTGKSTATSGGVGPADVTVNVKTAETAKESESKKDFTIARLMEANQDIVFSIDGKRLTGDHEKDVQARHATGKFSGMSVLSKTEYLGALFRGKFSGLGSGQDKDYLPYQALFQYEQCPKSIGQFTHGVGEHGNLVDTILGVVPPLWFPVFSKMAASVLRQCGDASSIPVDYLNLRMSQAVARLSTSIRGSIYLLTASEQREALLKFAELDYLKSSDFTNFVTELVLKSTRVPAASTLATGKVRPAVGNESKGLAKGSAASGAPKPKPQGKKHAMNKGCCVLALAEQAGVPAGVGCKFGAKCKFTHADAKSFIASEVLQTSQLKFGKIWDTDDMTAFAKWVSINCGKG